MRCNLSISRFALSALFLCVGMLGCQPSYPYYTNKGNLESREVHVHVSDGKVIEVPCGKGMGGGLDGLMPDADGIITKEQDGVVVKLKMNAGGAIPTVEEVTYNGKKCAAHEPVL